MELHSGFQLQNGKYRIEQKIGQGGFGITYRASWFTEVIGAMGKMETTVPVAIKEFFWKDYCERDSDNRTVAISSTMGRDMFKRFKEKLKKEAKILSRLRHPYIVSVLDIFEENNTAYMVMQFVEGDSLKDKITRAGILDEATALKYAGQLCSAVGEVHNNNILHLDIKPGNVLIDPNDNARLIDFGISKQYDEQQHETSTTPIGICKGFAPIEQYSGIKSFSPPADVYALGATIYNMLTGKIPIEATSRYAEILPPMNHYNPDVSAQTEKAVAKAMSISPFERYQTAADLWRELNTGQPVPDEKTKVEPKPKPPEPTPEKEPQPWYKNVWYVAGGIIAGGIIVAALWLFLFKPKDIVPAEKEVPVEEVKKEEVKKEEKKEVPVETPAYSEADFADYKQRAVNAYKMAQSTDPDYYSIALDFCNKALAIKDDAELTKIKQQCETKLNK